MAKTIKDKRYTDAQLKRWAAKQKRDYKAGKLTPEQIRKLESVPGWKWN